MLVQPLKKNSVITFRKQQKTENEPKTAQYPNDSVTISTKEKDLKTKLKKDLLASGALLTTLASAVLIIAKRRGDKIAKLYKDKLVISKLPENIQFTKFETVEEGIKYAKEFLKIKEVDKNFTIEAINTAIKGIIEVSNANKGRVFMPKRLGFEAPKNKDRNFLAYVVRNINSPHFGDLVINKNYFDEKVLNKEIDMLLFYKDGKKIYEFEDGNISSRYRLGVFYPFPQDDAQTLISRYYHNKANLTTEEKQTLFYTLEYAKSTAMSSRRNPISALKYIAAKKQDVLRQNNLTINFEEVEKMKTSKQQEYLDNLISKLEEINVHFEYWYGLESPARIVHHEMGHLQDYAKNLKELDIKRWKNISLKKIWQDITSNNKSRFGVDEVSNRWGSVWKDEYSKLYNENPEKFKKLYPDLYEFLSNQQIQQTAGKISSYAQSGIGEFIAETYARMISKKKIAKDVEELYKKYKGPELPQ